MTAQVVKALTDPAFLIALLVGVAVFATFFTLMPSLSGNTLKSRMKSVALERDELFIRQANAFLDAVEGRAAPLCSLAEGISTLRTNLAILESAQRRAWINVREI